MFGGQIILPKFVLFPTIFLRKSFGAFPLCNSDDSAFWFWSDLPLVQDLDTLNILLNSVMCLGWASLVLDVVTAAVKYYYRSRDSDTEDLQKEAIFWDNAILMEGLKYHKQ